MSGPLLLIVGGVVLLCLLVLVGGLALLIRRQGRELRESRAQLADLQHEITALREEQQALEAIRRAAMEHEAYLITSEDSNGAEPVPNRAVVSATIGEPLIKVAALSYGVRRALREEKRAHIAFQMRREYKRRRRRGRIAARRAG